MYGPSEKEWLAILVMVALFFMACGAAAYKLIAWVLSRLTITWS